MLMNLLRLACTAAIISSAACTSKLRSPDHDRQDVGSLENWPSVTVATLQPEFVLQFSISNHLESDFILRRGNVPWFAPANALKLAGVISNSITKTVKPLLKTFPITDGPIGDFAIRAHSTEAGPVDLSMFFPEVRAPNRSNRFIVTWQYVMYQEDSSQKYSGTVLIPFNE